MKKLIITAAAIGLTSTVIALTKSDPIYAVVVETYNGKETTITIFENQKTHELYTGYSPDIDPDYYIGDIVELTKTNGNKAIEAIFTGYNIDGTFTKTGKTSSQN